MISLKSLIPEIKIQPNISLKVGQIWETLYIVNEDDEDDLENGFEIGDKQIINYLIIKLDDYDVWFRYYEDNNYVDYVKWKRDLFLETIRGCGFRLVDKELNEIKIIPNFRKPKVEDKFIFPDEPELADYEGNPHEFIITKIEGNKISYQYYPYNSSDYVFEYTEEEYIKELQKGIIKIIK